MTAFNKAIPVLVSDTINIPQPGSYQSGQSSTGGATLTGPATAKYLGTFNPAQTGYSGKVAIGDVVYVDDNATNRPAFITQVTDVVSDNVLTLDPPVGGIAAPYNFKIYRSNGALANNLQGNPGYGLVGPFATNTIINCIPAGQEDPVFIKPNDTSDLSLENMRIQRVFNTGTVNLDAYGLVAIEPES
jgi:hypothetical protein